MKRSPRVKLEGEFGLLYQGPLALGAVLGGRYYTALGEIAPQANPADGNLDAVWIASASTWEMLVQIFGLVLLRRHIGSQPGRGQGNVFHASSLDGPVYLEVDGLPLGKLPATFTLLTRTLPVIMPAVGARVIKAQFAPLDELRGGRLVGSRKSASAT